MTPSSTATPPPRAVLHPREQAWFDELVCRARRHCSAIDRRPHLDFERPVMLAMLMEGMRELETTQAELEVARRQFDEAGHALAEAGMVRRRLRPMRPEEMGRRAEAVGRRGLNMVAKAATESPISTALHPLKSHPSPPT